MSEKCFFPDPSGYKPELETTDPLIVIISFPKYHPSVLETLIIYYPASSSVKLSFHLTIYPIPEISSLFCSCPLHLPPMDFM